MHNLWMGKLIAAHQWRFFCANSAVEPINDGIGDGNDGLDGEGDRIAQAILEFGTGPGHWDDPEHGK